MANKKNGKEAEIEAERREEFVWVADIKCTEPEVMRFVKENKLTAQEAFEEEACLYAGSKACTECDWRVKE